MANNDFDMTEYLAAQSAARREEAWEAHDLKPDWFSPAAAFLPFEGCQPVTDRIVYDLEVFEVPDAALNLRVKAPVQQKVAAPANRGFPSRIICAILSFSRPSEAALEAQT